MIKAAVSKQMLPADTKVLPPEFFLHSRVFCIHMQKKDRTGFYCLVIGLLTDLEISDLPLYQRLSVWKQVFEAFHGKDVNNITCY